MLIVGLCIVGFLQTGLNPFKSDEARHGGLNRPSVDIDKPKD